MFMIMIVFIIFHHLHCFILYWA